MPKGIQQTLCTLVRGRQWSLSSPLNRKMACRRSCMRALFELTKQIRFEYCPRRFRCNNTLMHNGTIVQRETDGWPDPKLCIGMQKHRAFDWRPLRVRVYGQFTPVILMTKQRLSHTHHLHATIINQSRRASICQCFVINSNGTPAALAPAKIQMQNPGAWRGHLSCFMPSEGECPSGCLDASGFIFLYNLRCTG